MAFINKLSLCFPYENYSPRIPIISSTGVITDAVLTMELNRPYQLVLTVNPNQSEVYRYLLERIDVGVRLQTNYGLDLVFVKQNDQPKRNVEGLLQIKFWSSSHFLEDRWLRKISLNRPYVGSAMSLLGQTTDEVVWEVIGNDQTVVIPSGTKTILELLEEIRETVGNWTWREAGVKNVAGIEKTVIQIGDFRTFDVSEYATNQIVDDPFSDNILIENAFENVSGDVYTHLLPYGSIEGSDESSALYFTDSSVGNIDPEFPLVNLNTRLSNGRFAHYLFNKNADTPSDSYFKYRPYPVQFSSNLEVDGEPVINVAQAKSAVYGKSKSYASSKQKVTTYTFDLIYPKIILPGTKVQVNYQNTRMFDDYEENININEILYTDGLEFSLANFKNNQL